MRLALFNRDEPFLKEVTELGETPVNTINGVMELEEGEKEQIINYSKKIYRRALERADVDFTGHIRLDLIPGVENFEKTSDGYRWDLEIKGAYEINSNAPECGAATAALHSGFPEVAKLQPDPARRITECLNGKIKNRKVAFVIGNGPVKEEWGKVFMERLKKQGLNVEERSCDNLEDCEALWRFGDVRKNAYSEFSDEFRESLLEKQKEKFVLNFVPPSPEEDIGNKRYLLSDNERELTSEADVMWALDRNRDLVLKPFQGASGRDITFKRNVSRKEWEKKLRDKIGKGFGLYRAKWLPRLPIDEVENGLAFDLSPSFLADGEDLDYLYTISRVDDYDKYINRGTINVAKGAGFVGCLVEK